MYSLALPLRRRATLDGGHKPAAGPQQAADADQLPLRSARSPHQQNATPYAGRTANRQASHHPVRLGRGEQRLGQAAAGKRDAGIRIFSEPADAGAIPGL